MNETNTPAQPPTLGMKDVCLLLSHPGRLALLREMSRGEILPRAELGRRTKQSPAMISRHLALLRRMGVVVRTYGPLHVLAPAYRPVPGATTLDFGHCLLRLDPPST